MTLKCIGMHLGGYVYSQVKPLTSKAAEKASLRLLLTVGSRQVQVCELGYVCPNSDAGAESAFLQTASTTGAMHVTKLIDYNTESILNESSRCRIKIVKRIHLMQHILQNSTDQSCKQDNRQIHAA